MKQPKWIVGPAVFALALGSTGVTFAQTETPPVAPERQGQSANRPLTEAQRTALRQAGAARKAAFKAARDAFRLKAQEILGDQANEETDATEQELTAAQVQALRAAVKARNDAFKAARDAYRLKVAEILGTSRPGADRPAAPAVTLSSAKARVASSSVELHFKGALDAAIASLATNYAVTVGATVIPVTSAALRGNNTVILDVPDTALQAGNTVVVAWTGLKDGKGGNIANGNATVTAR